MWVRRAIVAGAGAHGVGGQGHGEAPAAAGDAARVEVPGEGGGRGYLIRVNLIRFIIALELRNSIFIRSQARAADAAACPAWYGRVYGRGYAEPVQQYTRILADRLLRTRLDAVSFLG